jgi:hypothetical protein
MTTPPSVPSSPSAAEAAGLASACNEQPAPDFLDPRTRRDFEPAHWPLCDGGGAPATGVEDAVARRKIEFLAAYYRLNQWQARLQAIRAGAANEPVDAVMSALRDAMRDRDALEDRYESEGFLGEPVMDGVFYTNVEFTHARKWAFYQPPMSSYFSLTIPVPPPGAEFGAWIHQHLSSVFPRLGEATLPDGPAQVTVEAQAAAAPAAPRHHGAPGPG